MKFQKASDLEGWDIGRERVGWSAIPDDPEAEILYANSHGELMEKIRETNDNNSCLPEEG